MTDTGVFEICQTPSGKLTAQIFQSLSGLSDRLIPQTLSGEFVNHVANGSASNRHRGWSRHVLVITNRIALTRPLISETVITDAS